MTTPIEQQLTPPGGWQTPGRVRIAPISTGSASPWQRLALEVIQRFGKLDAANLWRLLMHNPRLMRGMLGFASKMMPFGELDRRDTELCILRVGWNCRARYEWGQHVDIGRRAGLTEADIARIPLGPMALGWSTKQQALLSACDEFHADRMVSAPTWQILEKYFEERLLLELLMLIGYYEGLAGVLNSVGLPLDTKLEQVLAASRIHRG
ncbi:MAG: carboxymuconolactone decarboxylase family protein [Pseudomonadota bacterium]